MMGLLLFRSFCCCKRSLSFYKKNKTSDVALNQTKKFLLAHHVFHNLFFLNLNSQGLCFVLLAHRLFHNLFFINLNSQGLCFVSLAHHFSQFVLSKLKLLGFVFCFCASIQHCPKMHLYQNAHGQGWQVTTHVF